MDEAADRPPGHVEGAGRCHRAKHSRSNRTISRWKCWKCGQDLSDGAGPVESFNEPPEDAWIPTYRELTAESPNDGATGMLFDGWFPQRQTEPDPSFIIHPRTRTRQQRGTRFVGWRIRLGVSPDHPPLARTIDQEIRV